jgi:hypothetical protein
MKRLSIFLSVAIFFIFISADAGAYTWYEYGGHWYTLTQATTNWEDCEVEAVSIGHHLVSINDIGENNFLYDTFKAQGYEVLAIGLTDKVAEGVWTWPDGTLVNFFNWEDGEPNNQEGIENYAAMHIQNAGSETGRWNDYTGTNLHLGNSYPGIIESNVNPVPLPGAFILLGAGLSRLAMYRRRKLKAKN